MDRSSKISYMWAVSVNNTKIRKPIFNNYFSPTNKQTCYHSYIINLVFYLHLACLPVPCLPSDPGDLGMTALKRKFWECGDKDATVNLQFSLFLAAGRSSVEKQRGNKLFLLFHSSFCLPGKSLSHRPRYSRNLKNPPRWAEHRSSGAIGSLWQS